MRRIDLLFILLVLIPIFIFFYPLLVQRKLPTPADTIIGLYHPFRDLYAKDYPNGIPFKNFLITDPARQIIPWKSLSIDLMSRFELPLWNPYQMAGTPLLANFQSSPFYPLNLILLIPPFPLSWSVFIMLQPILAGIFLYLYLQNLNLDRRAIFVGVIAFCFSGFSIAWLEWGTVGHTALWLPLVLLSVDKIFFYSQSKKISNIHIRNKHSLISRKLEIKKLFIWLIIFLFSLISSFLAGHLQVFFYIFIFTLVYFLARWFQYGKIFNILFVFLILNILFFILTSVQWYPTLEFILHSARNVDQSPLNNPGWFIPWQHLIQFVAPDFFGNPTTLNYWGVWNYAELVGYIGILPLIFALFALFFRHDKKTLFFGTVFFLSLIFSLPTIFAKIPFILNIPFLSTAQPTRLLFITDFSMALLAALGFDLFLRRKKGIVYIVAFLASILIGLWVFTLFGNRVSASIREVDLTVAKRNLILPTALFFTSAVSIFLYHFISKLKLNSLILQSIIVGMVVVTAFDLLRFGFKFMPFTKREYFFPNTKTIEFLKSQKGMFRVASVDSRIFPPNFSTYYRIQSIEGYDPLYLRSYAEFIAAVERGEPNISEPFGFNRIITPHNFEPKFFDLLNVRYILSLSDLSSNKLIKVYQERQTKVYENKNVVPRVFFVENVRTTKNKNETIMKMFREDFDPLRLAIVEDSQGVLPETPLRCTKCGAKIIFYDENKVIIETENDSDGFLVLTDSFYPTWHVTVDGVESRIYRTDYNFRGVAIPKGRHKVEFTIRPF